jgi:WD40 repeat protein
VWDLASVEEVRQLTGHADQVQALAVSPDGKLLASGGPDQTIRIWDLSSGACLRTLSLDGTVSVLAFSPQGDYLVSAGGKQRSESRNLRVWDRATWTEADPFSTPSSWIMDLAFSPDGKRLATGSRDQTVKLWDFATRDAVATFREHHSREHHGPVRAVAFSPDGRHFASGDQQGVIYLRRAASERDVQAGMKQR